MLVLLLFAAPVTQLRLGQPDDGNQPEGKIQRVAYDRLSEAFGPGSNGPFLFAIDIPKGDAGNEAALAKVQQAIAATPGMVKESVSPAAAVSEDGEMATIFAIPKTAPQDAAHQRPARAPARGRDPRRGRRHATLQVYIGGNTAGFEDFSAKVASRLPVFIAVVIGLSVLLLIMAFRSLWIPLVSAPSSTCCRSAPPTASWSASSRRASARACSASTPASRSSRSSP